MDTSMELDELKQAWHTLDLRLQRQATLNLQIFAEGRLDKTRSTLRWMMWRQAFQIAIWTALLVFVIGPFWIEHRATTHLLVLGLVIHAYAVLTIGVSVLQIVLMARIDMAAPVVTIQRQLVQLRSLRIRHNLLLSLPWWPLWVVGLVVGVKWWMGIDLYAIAPRFFYWTLGVGFAGLFATLWIARKLAARAQATGKPAPMADDLAGYSLRRAIDNLDEIARFKGE